MPAPCFFTPSAECQSLPLELQQSILTYLPVEDLARMTSASQGLTQAIVLNEPNSLVEFHDKATFFL